MPHTSGPWKSNDYSAGTHVYTEYKPLEYICICDSMLQGQLDTDKNLANARLIAAAPELLSVLKEINALFDFGHFQNGHEDVYDRMQSAIAKAEGREL